MILIRTGSVAYFVESEWSFVKKTAYSLIFPLKILKVSPATTSTHNPHFVTLFVLMTRIIVTFHLV